MAIASNRFSTKQILGIFLSLLVIGAFFYFNFFVFENGGEVSGTAAGQVPATVPGPEIDPPALPDWMIQSWIFVKHVFSTLFNLLVNS